MLFLFLACATAQAPSTELVESPETLAVELPTADAIRRGCLDYNKRLEECQRHSGVSDLLPAARVWCDKDTVTAREKWAVVSCSEGIFTSTNCMGVISVVKMLDKQQECVAKELAK